MRITSSLAMAHLCPRYPQRAMFLAAARGRARVRRMSAYALRDRDLLNHLLELSAFSDGTSGDEPL